MLAFASARARAHAAFAPLAVLLVCTVAPAACKRPASTATLLVTGALGGTTAPCGCTSRPLGGVDRIAAQVEAARAHGAAAWVVVGDTYFMDGEPSPSMRGHNEATGLTLAAIVERLAPAGVAPGPRDRAAAARAFAQLSPAVRQRLSVGAPQAAAVVARSLALGAIRLGLLQVEANALGNPTASASLAADLAAAAASARREGADGVVVLWPGTPAQARALLADLTGADAVVCGSEDAPAAPQPLGEAVLLDAGARGEHLGAMRLQIGAPGRWQYFDGGAAEIARLQRARRRMEEEAGRLPEGPARTARLTRAQALAEQAEAAVVAPPKTTYFTWGLVDVDEALPKAPWASERLDAYNQALCATARRDTAARACPAPERPEATYVGSATCQACHPAAWAVYEKTAHARAWATLTVAHKACDLSCVGCHVVGWEQPGGFCHLDDAEQWANVGCESCHGPGKGHVEHPEDRKAWGPQFVTQTPEATCRGCHNQEHSDQFDFATYRPRILGPGHGLFATGAP